ncbi:hypothetical protein C465_09720 [Halorubrum distributum JCM 9100]|uniref:Uncharacterized protein n=4 Tax=Halorubrum distributum TaxID=29283 RepID=M0EN79_9EURY|nr:MULTISPECIES: hypothetical protein [Halorubrum distributum group]ELZ48367.1 hypothetical protein C465_09720 [Halorubrum distributum JCM 9100]ELZ55650.1 hypothetical protein C466_04923 [Halorubrum distributum JCM 10118]EMA57434.1 hypothetical protein C470_14248 [Halorubrum litoreum JCM 13561]EMA67211.1 hypothetical protein C462_15459 [Halorubrum arcis JCM 13916]
MSAVTADRPRYATPTRVDVTDCRTDRLPDRVRANRVDGSEVHLERRGGRTFLVTRPRE